jgi:mono/diheme cytochrome c family protein
VPTRLTQRAGFALALAVAGLVAASCSTGSRPTTTPTVRSSPAGTTAGATAAPGEDAGAFVFRAHCAACHGTHGEGNLGPPLVGIAARMTAPAELALVGNGLGRMPSFADALGKDDIAAVVAYTRTQLR